MQRLCCDLFFFLFCEAPIIISFLTLWFLWNLQLHVVIMLIIASNDWAFDSNIFKIETTTISSKSNWHAENLHNVFYSKPHIVWGLTKNQRINIMLCASMCILVTRDYERTNSIELLLILTSKHKTVWFKQINRNVKG